MKVDEVGMALRAWVWSGWRGVEAMLDAALVAGGEVQIGFADFATGVVGAQMADGSKLLFNHATGEVLDITPPVQ